ncbi:hypothetical protein GGD69_005247 [Paraburkholderia fungorum]|uniref:Uncharacterized protein n=1 Tax=Paraburkholderia fungorum TaxID=134537 RepID=A0AAW3V135_9BURK|nr:hypothetical protein [Paraburkholderia fungorum]
MISDLALFWWNAPHCEAIEWFGHVPLVESCCHVPS